MIFELMLIVGVLGFAAMSLLGAMHGGGVHHGGGHFGGHFGGGHGHGLAGHSAISHSGAHLPAHAHGGAKSAKGVNLWYLPSLPDIFTMAVGFGATGLLIGTAVAGAWVIPLSIAGGIVLNFVIVRPVTNALMLFAAKPTEGLEGSIAATGEALTNFDRGGKGLVRLKLDNQIVQLLAQLDDAEVANGSTVSKGDEVVVTAVDSHSGTCRVTRELST